ncbi:Transcriptional regulatory protein CusR [Methylobrevis pamukkalensis]|uniref:Transcriptional regulatory protein CusR n=1 Tax=Methylobrevis pamukkalensis TaxID=1439726 RepID=A0A1E3H2L0_9HYPH|nr:Transcriptional regulatory protein CusR [Methylobrevis pamukkalensis]
MRVLVIEDDLEAAAYLRKALKEAGHTVDHAADGESGFDLASTGDYDGLVVDRMLPKRDGLSVIEGLRSAGVATPVLILSALGQVDDRVAGLRAGGDDYLVKPMPSPSFSPASRVSPGGCARPTRKPSTALPIWCSTACPTPSAVPAARSCSSRASSGFWNI